MNEEDVFYADVMTQLARTFGHLDNIEQRALERRRTDLVADVSAVRSSLSDLKARVQREIAAADAARRV